jgi:hypothetical protein
MKPMSPSSTSPASRCRRVEPAVPGGRCLIAKPSTRSPWPRAAHPVEPGVPVDGRRPSRRQLLAGQLDQPLRRPLDEDRVAAVPLPCRVAMNLCAESKGISSSRSCAGAPLGRVVPAFIAVSSERRLHRVARRLPGPSSLAARRRCRGWRPRAALRAAGVGLGSISSRRLERALRRVARAADLDQAAAVAIERTVISLRVRCRSCRSRSPRPRPGSPPPAGGG